jgi:hypothetical protein
MKIHPDLIALWGACGKTKAVVRVKMEQACEHHKPPATVRSKTKNCAVENKEKCCQP